MNCEILDDKLIGLAHDELDYESTAEASAHLAGCPRCAMAYCRLRAELHGVAIALCENRPRPEVRVALRARVAAAVQPKSGARLLASLRRPVPVYGAVLAAGAVALMWLASARSRPDESSPQPSSHAVAIDGYDADVHNPVPRLVL